jgi:hypothetical protein
MVIIGGSNPAYLNEGAEFINQGLVEVTGVSGLDFYEGGAGDIFDNLGTFEFAIDSQVYSDGCCGGRGNQAFNNQGLVWKSAGTNTTTISVPFNNLGGTIQVDDGLLSLSDGGSSSNATFALAAEAALDLTGGSNPQWSGQLTGSGAGQVLLSSGNIFPNPALTLAFTNNLFVWGGGTFYNGTVTNAGIVVIAGGGPAYLNEGATFINQSLVQVSGINGLDFSQSGPGDIFNNLPEAFLSSLPTAPFTVTVVAAGAEIRLSTTRDWSGKAAAPTRQPSRCHSITLMARLGWIAGRCR